MLRQVVFAYVTDVLECSHSTSRKSRITNFIQFSRFQIYRERWRVSTDTSWSEIVKAFQSTLRTNTERLDKYESSCYNEHENCHCTKSVRCCSHRADYGA